jgi:hypothetical protein
MLSDECHQFLMSVQEAAERLAEAAHWYSAPNYPIPYGEEIDALRRAAARVAVEPIDADAMVHLLKLAASVLKYHDISRHSAAHSTVKEEMTALVRIFQTNAEPTTADTVPALVESLTKGGADAEEKAIQVRSILTKLSKPAYDMAVKIISDIGSATMKKLLGL